MPPIHMRAGYAQESLSSPVVRLDENAACHCVRFSAADPGMCCSGYADGTVRVWRLSSRLSMARPNEETVLLEPEATCT